MRSELYGEEYFLRGKQSGVSLYEDYRWLPELTVPMARRMVQHLGVVGTDQILDFGCARGYTVKALRELGYCAFGYDISEWAVENSDPDVYYHLTTCESTAFHTNNNYDWIIAKDVLEHVHSVAMVIKQLMEHARKGVFAVVPLSRFNGGEYVIRDYEKDVTHTQRHTLTTWIGMFLQQDWSVEASYRVPGIKDNWYKPGWERGNGFIVAQRIKE